MDKLIALLARLFGGFSHAPSQALQYLSMLDAMRAIEGTHEVSGSADNPVILSWPNEIAAKFPEMANYCKEYTHDAIPWCGLTVAICATRCGFRPVYRQTDPLHSFLWAQAWKDFGTEVDEPEPGDVIVFPRHVSVFVKKVGGNYCCLGGNQSDQVKESYYAAASVDAIRRHP